MRHNHFYRIFQGLPDVNGFLDMLDKCLAEVTTAVKTLMAILKIPLQLKTLMTILKTAVQLKLG